ncbi:MAG: hydrogenase maturation protease [Candidatus Thiodiazotropha sp. (ex Monitilora ramsayi)]|nr:hydrogenase maturation protease [Candidatus Thiodiazotropha sp. (ex Monitilora ramsayi)]
MIRVIGVGSPFGADRLAWLAVDHLSTLQLSECELIKLDRPGSQLLNYFREVLKVILIDAVALDETPGGASLLAPVDLQQISVSTSSHGFGVAQTLALGTQLGQMPPDFHLIGIHTGIALSELPSLDVEALERLVLPLI